MAVSFSVPSTTEELIGDAHDGVSFPFCSTQLRDAASAASMDSQETPPAPARFFFAYGCSRDRLWPRGRFGFMG